MGITDFFSRFLGKREVNAQKIWIVSGPSSSGKSTFIASERCRTLTGLDLDMAVITAGSFRAGKIERPSLVHYNILRPYVIDREQPYNFANDKKWRNICSSGHDLEAIIIRTSRDVLLHRINTRKIVERKAITGKPEKSYNRKKWGTIYSTIQLDELYGQWLLELEKNGIPYVTVNGNNSEFEILNAHGAL